MSDAPVLVSVGVIYNSFDQILITSRHYQSKECWEFPGGKVESGESIETALKRELWEEVGVEVISHQFLLAVEHEYPDKKVSLQVYQVKDYKGEPQGLIGQKLRWVYPSELSSLPVLEANHLILEAL